MTHYCTPVVSSGTLCHRDLWDHLKSCCRCVELLVSATWKDFLTVLRVMHTCVSGVALMVELSAEALTSLSIQKDLGKKLRAKCHLRTYTTAWEAFILSQMVTMATGFAHWHKRCCIVSWSTVNKSINIKIMCQIYHWMSSAPPT